MQLSLKGLDQKKHLINIAIQISTKNYRGVKVHVTKASLCGAKKNKIIGTEVINPHLNPVVTVLECRPSAHKSVEDATKVERWTSVSRSAEKTKDCKETRKAMTCGKNYLFYYCKMIWKIPGSTG